MLYYATMNVGIANPLSFSFEKATDSVRGAINVLQLSLPIRDWKQKILLNWNAKTHLEATKEFHYQFLISASMFYVCMARFKMQSQGNVLWTDFHFEDTLQLLFGLTEQFIIYFWGK